MCGMVLQGCIDWRYGVSVWSKDLWLEPNTVQTLPISLPIPAMQHPHFDDDDLLDLLECSAYLVQNVVLLLGCPIITTQCGGLGYSRSPKKMLTLTHVRIVISIRRFILSFLFIGSRLAPYHRPAHECAQAQCSHELMHSSISIQAHVLTVFRRAGDATRSASGAGGGISGAYRPHIVCIVRLCLW